MIDDEKRGKLICELRKKQKLTQKELGDLINYTDKNISKWERGISFPTNPNIIKKLSEVLEVSVEELMYGELRQKNNEVEIRENFEEQFKNNYNKYQKNLFKVLILLLMFIIICLILIYKIFIKSSVSAYSLVAKDSNFDWLNSTLLITNKINILNFSKIDDRDDIQLISLYYVDEQGTKKEIFKGENSDYFIEEKRNYEEYFLEQLIKNKIYLKIDYKNNDKSDVIEIKTERKYINDNIFPERVVPSIKQGKEKLSKELNDELLLMEFIYNEGIYEKKINQDATVLLDIDTMNLMVEINKNKIIERINGNCHTNSLFYEKFENGEIVENKEIKINEDKNCELVKCTNIDDYAMYLNFIKNELK